MAQGDPLPTFEKRLAAVDGPASAAELITMLGAGPVDAASLATAVQATGEARLALKQARKLNWMLAMALPILFVLGLVAHELGSM
jgi:hypothetical protein